MATEAVQPAPSPHDMEGSSDQSNSLLSAAVTPIKTASEQAEVVTNDELERTLNDANMRNGNDDTLRYSNGATTGATQCWY